MTLVQDVRIGRITLHEPYAARTGSRGLVLTGQESTPGIDDLTVGEVQARRGGLVGLTGRVVPVVFAAMSDLDGWYRITDVAADPFRFGDDFLRFDWTVTAERVAEPARGRVDLRARHVHRSNDHSIAAGDRWVALPPSTLWGQLPAGAIVHTRESADGTVTIGYDWSAAADTAAYGILPVNAYKAAAEVTMGGLVVEGEGVHRDGYGAAAWRAGNGLVRLAGVDDGTAWARLEAWSSAAAEWESVVDLFPVAYGDDLITPAAVEVLRNTPDEVAVRSVFAVDDSGTPRRVTADVVLRRGATFATLLVRCPTATTIAVETTIGAWSTPTTGVRQATSADANGNSAVLGATSFTATADGITDSSVTELAAFVGAVVDSAGAATADEAAALLAQWLDTPLLDARIVRG